MPTEAANANYSYPTKLCQLQPCQPLMSYYPRRLESLGVSAPPKKKRVKMSSESVPSDTCTNLLEVPSELMAEVLDFLWPDPIRPINYNCGLVNLSRVSNYFRSLALSNHLWRRICITRWKAKVGLATRLANAEAEATNDTVNTATSLIRGGFWYRKFVVEERDALRSTISCDELRTTTFSIKFWFQTKLLPDMKRIKGVVASGLDGPSFSDNMRFDLTSGTILGMSEADNRIPFFVNDDGSIIDIRTSHPTFSLHVFRRMDWGWELRSQVYVVRSVDNDCTEQLWDDYASSLIIEKRKKSVPCTRGNVKYKRREVPDVEEIKEFLKW